MSAAACLTALCGAALPGPATAGPPSLAVLWRTRVHKVPAMAWQPRNPGEALLGPDGRVVYFPGADGLHALRAATGHEVWRYPTGEALPGPPLLVQGVLYVVTAGGRVHGVRARTGHKAWPEAVDLGAVVRAGLATDGPRLFAVGDPGLITALRRSDGKVIWRNNRTIVREFLVEGHGAALVDAGVVYAGLTNGRLVALAARDGGAVWEVSLGKPRAGPYVDIDHTPVLLHARGRKLLLVASHNTGLYALDPRTGETRWQYRAEGLGEPRLHGGRIYSIASSGALHALDPRTGRRLLARKIAGEPSGAMAFAGELLLVPGARGLQILSLATGRGLARVVDEFGFSAAPRMVGHDLFVLSNGGIAYRLRLVPGTAIFFGGSPRGPHLGKNVVFPKFPTASGAFAPCRPRRVSAGLWRSARPKASSRCGHSDRSLFTGDRSTISTDARPVRGATFTGGAAPPNLWKDQSFQSFLPPAFACSSARASAGPRRGGPLRVEQNRGS